MKMERSGTFTKNVPMGEGPYLSLNKNLTADKDLGSEPEPALLEQMKQVDPELSGTWTIWEQHKQSKDVRMPSPHPRFVRTACAPLRSAPLALQSGRGFAVADSWRSSVQHNSKQCRSMHIPTSGLAMLVSAAIVVLPPRQPARSSGRTSWAVGGSSAYCLLLHLVGHLAGSPQALTGLSPSSTPSAEAGAGHMHPELFAEEQLAAEPGRPHMNAPELVIVVWAREVSVDLVQIPDSA